jgi:hypothetical protein
VTARHCPERDWNVAGGATAFVLTF